MEEKGWKDKIKEYLNHKDMFERVPNADGSKCFWRIREGHEESIPEVHSCSTCGERFGKDTYLKAHLVQENHEQQQSDTKQHHNNEDANDKFAQNDMRLRLKLTHDDELDHNLLKEKVKPYLRKGEYFQCPKCLVKKKRSNDLLQHMRRLHFLGEFSCLQCGAEAEYADDLLEHMKQSKHIQDPSVQCPLCGGKVSMYELKSHYKECFYRKDKENSVCTTCGKLIRKTSMRFHQRMHLREQGLGEEDAKSKIYYYCDICGKKVTTATGLATHKRDIHNPAPVTCSVCGLIFPSKPKLRIHYDREHNPKQCEHCDYKTGNTQQLERHMAKHFDPKFKCSYCEKMLKSKRALDAHERDHTGERPYECNDCGKGFKSNSVLITHRKHVHKILTPGMTPIEKRVRKK